MVKADKFISPGQRQFKSEKGLVVLGVDLQDAREEIFVRLVCDGVSLGVAFIKAGFKASSPVAASKLFNLDRIQQRAAAILEARRNTGVVTLPEVTSMLQRVFSGAYTEGEYSAAHNAAFSLARLYGHVTDRATLEVIRRPSRDPDAPSEQALASWVDALPGLEASGPEALSEARFLRVSDAPAAPLGHASPKAQPQSPNDFNGLGLSGPLEPSLEPQGPGPQGPEFSNDFKHLDWSGTGVAPGRPENGAPTRPVTGTPISGGRTTPLGPGVENGAPLQSGQVPVLTGEFPSAEELFGDGE